VTESVASSESSSNTRALVSFALGCMSTLCLVWVPLFGEPPFLGPPLLILAPPLGVAGAWVGWGVSRSRSAANRVAAIGVFLCIAPLLVFLIVAAAWLLM